MTFKPTNVDFAEDRPYFVGGFSRIYCITDSGGKEEAYAVKISKDRFEHVSATDGYLATRAWSPGTNAYAEARIRPSDLIERQYDRCRHIKHDGWAAVRNIEVESDRTIVVMEWIEAPTLRDLISCTSYDLAILIDIACVLSDLIDSASVRYHGDIKPENILVKDGKPILCDPGFFGSVQIDEERELDVAVTTWQYYPWLQPNDMFAFGAMILDMACGVHPFSDTLMIKQQQEKLGPALCSYINQVARNGNQFIRCVERLPQFIERFGGIVDSDLLRIALTCMGIENNDGYLELAPSYESFAKLVEALGSVRFPDEVYYHQARRPDQPIGVTTILAAGVPSAFETRTGKNVLISKRVKSGTIHKLLLTVENSTQSCFMRITGIYSVEGNMYVALAEPYQSIDALFETIWLLKVEASACLSTASIEEINMVAQIYSEVAVDERLVTNLLGSFAES